MVQTDFFEELQSIERQIQCEKDSTSAFHLLRVERIGRVLFGTGLATAWTIPNPFSAIAIGLSKYIRWIVAHHVLHGAYDDVPRVPNRLQSKRFAKGWRRYIDWLDPLHPVAWSYEHNVLHHYSLGELKDPDQVEINMDWIRRSELPVPLKVIVIALFACCWKFTYYAAQTAVEVTQKATPRSHNYSKWKILFAKSGFKSWILLFRSIFPYIAVNFVFIPLCFAIYSKTAGFYVLINMLLAEIVTNIWGFIMIVPSHAGSDLQRFTSRLKGKREFFLRQIAGSVNYRTGGEVNDLVHGFLNYQIEHHLFPKATMMQYQTLQPRISALCRKYGVNYRQEGVLVRLQHAIHIMVGERSMVPRERATSDF